MPLEYQVFFSKVLYCKNATLIRHVSRLRMYEYDLDEWHHWRNGKKIKEPISLTKNKLLFWTFKTGGDLVLWPRKTEHSSWINLGVTFQVDILIHVQLWELQWLLQNVIKFKVRILSCVPMLWRCLRPWHLCRHHTTNRNQFKC